MKITVLIDNTPHPLLNLCFEHGLSIFIEYSGSKWLVDVGKSDGFLHNAQKLNIDISDVDYLVVTHGHIDHSGGLESFMKVNSKARIFISSKVKENTFYSYSKGYKRDISANNDLVDCFKDRFIFIDRDILIAENIALINKYNITYQKPRANKVLYREEQGCLCLDEFEHELTLTFRTERGLVVFAGCAHNGILNILSTCSSYFNEADIDACIGGTHLVDSSQNFESESEIEIKEIATTILSLYPNMQLLTGHCTGSHAMKQLALIMGNKLKEIYTGASFTI